MNAGPIEHVPNWISLPHRPANMANTKEGHHGQREPQVSEQARLTSQARRWKAQAKGQVPLYKAEHEKKLRGVSKRARLVFYG